MTFHKFEDAFGRFNYPTGEVHVELKQQDLMYDDDVIIEAHCRTAEDLFAVAMASNILRSEARFLIPYLPFARHDHIRDNLDGFPISIVEKLLDDVNVITVDPHSDVTANMYMSVWQQDVVKFFRNRTDNDNIIFLIPDAGATKKAYTWLTPEDRYLQGMKKRDRATGKLSGFTIIVEDLFDQIKDSTVVIVDDICDGGGTFIGLKEALMALTGVGHQPARFELWVTHGMFQMRKWEDLTFHFDRILSFKNVKNEYLYRQPPFELFDFKDILNDH